MPLRYCVRMVCAQITGGNKKGRCNMRSSTSHTIRFVLSVLMISFIVGSQEGARAADNTTGTGATTAINDFQFAGAATMTIHGQEKTADVLVTVLEPPVVDANGVQHVKATHEFTFADGSSFITSDLEIATPTETEGLYTIIATMDITSGTGMYEGVAGRLQANGKIDFAAQPPAAQFELAGAVICWEESEKP